MNEIILIAVAYLLGSIPFGLIVSRLAGIDDIRKMGSGNIGATNVWRVAGFKAAIWVFVGDIGKGAAAVALARYLAAGGWIPSIRPDHLFVICAIAVVLGHVFPVFLKFRGGKGVNTALGAIAAMLPVETLISFGVFVLAVMAFRYISLGSIVGAVTLCVVVMIEKFAMERGLEMIYVYLSIVLALLIIFTHRGNIARLVSGTENKFSFSSKTKKEDAGE